MSAAGTLKSSGIDRPGSIENPLLRTRIYNDICEYEDTLGRLVASVDKFQPDMQIARDLMKVDQKLSETVKALREYDAIDGRAKKLEAEHRETDAKTAKVLEVLTECHDELNTLPMLEQVEFERATMLKQREKVFTNVLLDYAMKLAKFTHVPPTFDKGTVGPNNFVWPAEDAMRRGMLAIASLRAAEEVQSATEAKGDEEKKPEPAEESQIGENREELSRRASYEFNGGTRAQESEEKPDEDIDLDLDLLGEEF
ncbi:LADA_0F05138g1_1 [Lachancea dasiensis]|uniref:Mediator of RNA polymerase II transcription subunit 4 n=1 Tax=Lachancea dasiensis TaxID=1072105 RepID=A0A1G4JJI1_9SACH|nr:LADA_0F05138g1_1 [Lachancea dasiensis]